MRRRFPPPPAQARAGPQRGASAMFDISTIAQSAEQTEVDEEEEDAILEDEQNNMYSDNIEAELD